MTHILPVLVFTSRSSNIGEFSRDMRMLAALQEEDNDGDRLMDAARKLAGAFTDLLTAAQPGTSQVGVRVCLTVIYMYVCLGWGGEGCGACMRKGIVEA